MADTYVKRIVAAIAALVDGAGKPAGLVVSTSRKRATASDKALKHIAIYPVRDEEASESTPRSRTFAGARRLLRVAVDCRCAGTDLDNEALRAWAFGQAMKDTTLGGLCVDVDEGATDWSGDLDSQADYSEAAMEVVVEYARPRATLERAQ